MLILAVAYILFKYGEAKMVLPTISMYALALYRTLPSVTGVLNQYNEIAYNQLATNIVFKSLTKTIVEEDLVPLDFNKKSLFKTFHSLISQNTRF